jgi:hypothetical protein
MTDLTLMPAEVAELSAAFCIEAVEDALARCGKPEIYDADQGSQYPSPAQRS